MNISETCDRPPLTVGDEWRHGMSVIKISGGRIIEEGTHAQLLSKGGS